MTDKIVLRASLRARRAAFAPTGPIRVDPRFLALLDARMIVASYVPVGGEADPAPLEAAALAAGCSLALPHVVDRATPLVFLPWNAEVALEAGPYGLRQPARGADAVLPDLIITPLVGFDRSLGRLGQGAGHYDRAFATLPDAVRVGVGWSVQEVASLPADPWDVPLHAIATEKEWIA